MQQSTRSYDVIIAGGGGSGLAAAARCAELGLSVLVLEKQPQLGGTTGIAVGSFTANRTRFQQRSGIEDPLDDHATDAGRFAPLEIEQRNHETLRRYFLSEAATTLNWLAGMGLAFHGPSPEPPNRVPRMHNVIPNAKSYIAALQSRLLRFGGELHCNRSVTELVRDDGHIRGVVTNGSGGRANFHGRLGVVLAAGELCELRNLPRKSLEETVAAHNRERETGELPSLKGNRWVVLGPVRAYFTTTEGGAAINQRMQVLDNDGCPIPGLYAIGQNGLGGQILWGHGLHIAWATTSGRLVAEYLAQQAQPSSRLT